MSLSFRGRLLLGDQFLDQHVIDIRIQLGHPFVAPPTAASDGQVGNDPESPPLVFFSAANASASRASCASSAASSSVKSSSSRFLSADSSASRDTPRIGNSGRLQSTRYADSRAKPTV